jgi:polyhydroxyalkanoate synthesis regulator phasin
MAKSTIKSYVEAGAQFRELSRQQAEAFVKNLVASGDIRRRDAEQILQTMLTRGRETTSQLTALVQSEVAKQLSALFERFEDVESRLESLAASLRDGLTGAGGAAPTPTRPAPGSESSSATSAPQHTTAQKSEAKKSTKKSTKKASAKKSAAKKTSAKKSAAKKSAAKKLAAKKSAAKKSSTKRSTAKKSPAKKSTAVGSSGVRKVSTSRSASSE